MCSKFLIGENSGLLVLSKYPITFQKFKRLPGPVWPDLFAAKGALYFSVAGQNFITTHLQSDHISVALKQLLFLHESSPFPDDYILLGDLNLAPPCKLFEIISNNAVSTCTTGQVLDHIIAVKSTPFSVQVDKINLSSTSDHWPVIGYLDHTVV